MLQSEFFERTKVTLDGDRYAKVEAVYNEIRMDKDEFCAEWKKARNGKEIDILNAQLNEKDRFHQEEMFRQSKKQGEALTELAKKIILTNSDEKRLYDVMEEDFGIGFIIRTKHEAGIPLSEDEINYMVSKL